MSGAHPCRSGTGSSVNLSGIAPGNAQGNGSGTISFAPYLAAPQQPPHDPRRLPLSYRSGWRVAHFEHTGINADGALALQPDPATLRQLNEASGAFGGLTLPAHMAYLPDCGLLLLDRLNALLKRFDPCSCSFQTVPCTGGIGSEPRQFSDPGGVAICGDNLLIADSGNRRLAVYSLHGYLLRGFWEPPATAIAQPWRPVDVAIAYRNRVLVADPNNGCVHEFNFAGRWLRCIEGVGAVQHIAVDCGNRLYVSRGAPEAVSIYTLPTATKTSAATLAAEVQDHFAAPALQSNRNGLINVGPLCLPPQRTRWIDANGNAAKAPELIQATYATAGTLLSEPLDSHLYRCQWDRLSLRAILPEGTRIKVRTFTAETLLTRGQVQAQPDTAWATNQTVFPDDTSPNGNLSIDWDCLIRSQPGRYLWLQLELLGDSVSTPEIESLWLDFPRISLRRYLPSVFGEEPQAADFTDRFLAVYDRGFRAVERQLDLLARLFDPLSAPAGSGKGDFLSWLASWIGVVLDRQLPLARRRLIVKNAGRLFACRGTRAGLKQMLELYLGLADRHCEQKTDCGPCTTRPPATWQPPQLILEHFTLRRWLFLGAGRLGEQARLWGANIVNRSQLSGPQTDGNARLGVSQLKTTQDPLHDPFHVYAHKFTLFLPAWIGRLAHYRQMIERLVAAEKPAHTQHQINYVEPRFRIGIQAMIGYDAVIGCYPQGITLDQTQLGKASVLSEQDRGNSTLRVGHKARIGSTTQLK